MNHLSIAVLLLLSLFVGSQSQNNSNPNWNNTLPIDPGFKCYDNGLMVLEFITYSPNNNTLAIAQYLAYQRGVRATFYVSPESQDMMAVSIIKQIIGMGHTVGIWLFMNTTASVSDQQLRPMVANGIATIHQNIGIYPQYLTGNTFGHDSLFSSMGFTLVPQGLPISSFNNCSVLFNLPAMLSMMNQSVSLNYTQRSLLPMLNGMCNQIELVASLLEYGATLNYNFVGIESCFRSSYQYMTNPAFLYPTSTATYTYYYTSTRTVYQTNYPNTCVPGHNGSGPWLDYSPAENVHVYGVHILSLILVAIGVLV